MFTPKKTVLIVDDAALFPALKETVLSIAPEALVIQANDGNEALKKVMNQRFDLVITDLKLPKMDGKTLVQSFQTVPAQYKPTAVIVFSGEMSSENLRAELGAVTFVSKLAPPAEFVEVVRKMLGLAQSTASKPAKVDVAFINPFIEGVLNVLSTTANVQAKKENLFVRGNDQISGDVSAVIAMNSQSFLGSMAICFEKSCFLYIVSSMLGEAYQEVTAENQDAAGEICNQVFGYAKKKLNEIGHTIKPAIPSVIVGDRHAIKHMVTGVCIAVRFSTEKGSFTIEAIVHPLTV